MEEESRNTSEEVSTQSSNYARNDSSISTSTNQDSNSTLEESKINTLKKGPGRNKEPKTIAIESFITIKDSIPKFDNISKNIFRKMQRLLKHALYNKKLTKKGDKIDEENKIQKENWETIKELCIKNNSAMIELALKDTKRKINQKEYKELFSKKEVYEVYFCLINICFSINNRVELEERFNLYCCDRKSHQIEKCRESWKIFEEYLRVGYFKDLGVVEKTQDENSSQDRGTFQQSNYENRESAYVQDRENAQDRYNPKNSDIPQGMDIGKETNNAQDMDFDKETDNAQDMDIRKETDNAQDRDSAQDRNNDKNSEISYDMGNAKETDDEQYMDIDEEIVNDQDMDNAKIIELPSYTVTFEEKDDTLDFDYENESISFYLV